MSNSTNAHSDTSEIKQAAKQADAAQIKKNLDEQSATNEPESLTEEQKTPFIDDDVRTDR